MNLDRERLREVQSGAPEAVDAWYRQEHPEVYRLCLGLLAHVAEAEDLAQDAMLRLLDRLPRWNPALPYRPWRTTVVLNLCRDHLRARARSRIAPAGDGMAPVWEQFGGPLPPPEDQASRAELRQMLSAALAVLPEREREAFVLHDLEGLDGAQAAVVMEVGESSVRSLLCLARRRLRRLLAPRLVEAPLGGTP